MNDVVTLRKYLIKILGQVENEEVKQKIKELFSLCVGNVEEGDSESNEVSLCYNDVVEVLKENNIKIS